MLEHSGPWQVVSTVHTAISVLRHQRFPNTALTNCKTAAAGRHIVRPTHMPWALCVRLVGRSSASFAFECGRPSVWPAGLIAPSAMLKTCLGGLVRPAPGNIGYSMLSQANPGPCHAGSQSWLVSAMLITSALLAAQLGVWDQGTMQVGGSVMQSGYVAGWLHACILLLTAD